MPITIVIAMIVLLTVLILLWDWLLWRDRVSGNTISEIARRFGWLAGLLIGALIGHLWL